MDGAHHRLPPQRLRGGAGSTPGRLPLERRAEELEEPRMTDKAAQSLYGEELSPGALVGGYVVEDVRYRGTVATLYHARQAPNPTPPPPKLTPPPSPTPP